MNFNRIAPEGTFIGDYMMTCAALETPSVYDFWGAVWVLGSLLGRGVYVPRPHAPVHMNWYIMLVAESGVTRKSTACRIARDIVSDFDTHEHIIAGRATPEFLFNRLTKRERMFINVSELVTFLGRENYVMELPAFLTDLYDCPRTMHGGTVSRGANTIIEPYVTFMSASTPSWLRGAVNPSVIEGGFTSRCLFIHDERPKARVPWPDLQGVDVKDLHSVLGRTLDAAHEVRTIELMPAARTRYDNWYTRRDVASVVPFIASFNSREDAHVLRLAATLAVNDGSLAVSRTHMDFAIKMIARVKAGAVSIFQETGKTIKIAQGVERITRALIDAGPVGVQHTRLSATSRYYVPKDDFNLVMTIMHEAGMVEKMVETRNGAGRRGVRYVRADGLTNRKKMEELLSNFT